MGKIRKLISLLLIFNMVFLSININAEEPEQSVDYRALHFAKAFGFMDSIENWQNEFSREVKREEFAKVLFDIIKPQVSVRYPAFEDIMLSPYKEEIDSMAVAGYFNGKTDLYFAPEENITYNEAVKILVVAAGYEDLAKMSGGFPGGYLSAAGTTKITSGIKVSEKFNVGNLIEMIYNLACVHVPTMNKSVGDTAYVDFSEDNITFMEKYLSVAEGKGILTDNGKSSLYNDSDVIIGEQIAVDGVCYETSVFSEAKDLLGLETVFYYTTDDKSTPEIVYIYANEDKMRKVTEFNMQDIDGINGNVIEYSDKNRSKKLKISNDVVVIYNGKAEKSYDESFFDYEFGTVKYVEGSNQDVLIINGYVSWFVTNVDETAEKIYSNKESKPIDGSNSMTLLKEYLGKEITISDTYGEYSDYSGIGPYRVFDISKNGDITDIKLTSHADGGYEKTGKLTMIDKSENEIEVDGVRYPVSKSFFESEAFGKFEIGDNISFFKNTFEYIVYAEKSEVTLSPNIGLITRVIIDDGDDVYAVKVLTVAGIGQYPIAKNVVYSDETNWTRTVSRDVALELLSELKEVVEFELNNKGEISELYVATNVDVKREDGRLGKVSYFGGEYAYGGTSLAGNIMFASDVKAFVHDTYCDDKDSEYRIEEFQNYYAGYWLLFQAAYNHDPYSKYAEFVYCTPQSPAFHRYDVAYGTRIVVDTIGMGINSENMTVPMISGYDLLSNGSRKTFYLDESIDLNNVSSTVGQKEGYELRKGDIIIGKPNVIDNKTLDSISLLYSPYEKNPWGAGKEGFIVNSIGYYDGSTRANPVAPRGGDALNFDTYGVVATGSVVRIDKYGIVTLTTKDLSSGSYDDIRYGEDGKEAAFYEYALSPAQLGSRLIYLNYNNGNITIRRGLPSDFLAYTDVGNDCSRFIRVSAESKVEYFIIIDGEM